MRTGSKFRVGIAGLGSMGVEVTLSCVHVNPSTWDADLDSNVCATLKEVGACGVSDNTAILAEKLDALLILVANATQVKQVLFDEKGVAQHLKPDTAVMVSSTIASADAREIAIALVGFGLEMLDTPISGGAVKAANGEMTVMVSGNGTTFERLAPVLEAIAGRVYRIGTELGLGSTVEITHQLLAGVHVAAGAETIALVARAGIPLDMMYDTVTNTARNSWTFENRMRHMVDSDYTPHSTVDIFVKDLGLIADIAKALHFPLPLASTALSMFTSTSNAGYGKGDDNAVIKIFSGITLPGAKS